MQYVCNMRSAVYSNQTVRACYLPSLPPSLPPSLCCRYQERFYGATLKNKTKNSKGSERENSLQKGSFMPKERLLGDLGQVRDESPPASRAEPVRVGGEVWAGSATGDA